MTRQLPTNNEENTSFGDPCFAHPLIQSRDEKKTVRRAPVHKSAERMFAIVYELYIARREAFLRLIKRAIGRREKASGARAEVQES